nr:MAG TPA: hypothetical protein [Caudoviricetes sp.]
MIERQKIRPIKRTFELTRSREFDAGGPRYCETLSKTCGFGSAKVWQV